jgi:MFS family permease
LAEESETVVHTENVESEAVTDTVEKTSEKLGTFSSLRFRDFRFLLTGTVLSNTGQWIQQVTLSWVIYDLTTSGTMLGTLNLIRSLASLSMIPIAGVLIDRMNRRSLMISTNAWLFAITFTMGIIILTGHLSIAFLFVFSFLGGMAQSVDNPIRQVMVFDLVPRKHSPNALALIQTGWSIMRSFGPSIGAFLILWFGPGGNFLTQAGLYVLIAVNIFFIQFPVRARTGISTSPLQNIKAGGLYIIKQPVTRTFLLLSFILYLLIIPIFSVLPAIYAVEVFHGGPEVLGYLMSAVGIGGILGGFSIASLSLFERRGLLQVIAVFLISTFLICFSFCTKLWIALPFLVLAGFFEIIFLTSNQTLIQLSIPNEIRGQVTSIISFTSALSPLGGLIAGIGSDLLGGPKLITIINCSLAICVALMAYIVSSTLRNYRLSAAINNQPVKTS